ncbi:TVG0275213 [Thermoplasma volcanium GSS1]|uniref:TVG0275213 protein n=1 Tax=Thermoplasma volcanium (strain ATCC 51530 / DSM 4299 / JCM 9571 / NBRC 15438 / GSS1) TaxID=273116 RepID=Q97C42_THEVO|nr:TVG0275213 [Thermoplasma volcanium GSS1]
MLSYYYSKISNMAVSLVKAYRKEYYGLNIDRDVNAYTNVARSVRTCSKRAVKVL